MCGRYDNLIPRDQMTGLFRVAKLLASNFPPRYNIASTQEIPIVRLGRDGQRELVMARWGLVPFWMKEKPKKAFINAKAETVHSTPMFREAFANRRCLIPATGFYEWQKRADGKQPYRIRRQDLEPFAFAGLWEFARINGEEILSAAIIVTEANALVARLHDRIPVILLPESYDEWLDPDSDIERLRQLLRPVDPSILESYPVSRIVNSPGNDWEQCIEQLPDDQD